MKKLANAKKAFLIIIAALMLAAIACTPRQGAGAQPLPTKAAQKETPAPSEIPTEEPTTEPTTEPTEAPTAEPSAAPTVAPMSIDSLPVEVDNNQTINIDIDFDGIMDTIVFEEEKLEYYESTYKLTVARGAAGAEPFVYEVSYGKAAGLIIMDCDENDSRIDILLSWDSCSDDPASLICRVNEDGSGMFTQEGSCYFSIYDTSLKPGEFEISVHANVLNADFLGAVATVDASGLKLVDDFKFSTYEDSYWLEHQSLEREMTVRIVNDDGSLGEEVTVPVGEHIVPVSTDLESYVKLRIPDGRIGQVEFSFNYEAPYIRLNDISQDDYFTEPLNYAG
ncbi:MAG: hypothetical protein IKI64_04845 [Clostridia bacterium]|nr:hypothetical protein [Clostridia bacterium]